MSTPAEKPAEAEGPETSAKPGTKPEPATEPKRGGRPEGVEELGGPRGPEPTRYGDWEKGGRCSDF